jgi:hypothetical protein
VSFAQSELCVSRTLAQPLSLNPARLEELAQRLHPLPYSAVRVFAGLVDSNLLNVRHPLICSSINIIPQKIVFVKLAAKSAEEIHDLLPA